MALKDITIIRANGGLGRVAVSEDSTSALMFYVGEKPAEINKAHYAFSSLEECEAAGIKNDTENKTSVFWYHIAEFFRLAPDQKLFVTVVENKQDGTPFDGQFSELIALQSFAYGLIRQVGIYAPLQKLNKTHIANLQARADDVSKVHTPLSIIYAPKIESSDLTNLEDLKKLTQPKVSVLIGEDGGGLGRRLRRANTENFPVITCVGAAIGALARAKVSESIAWVEKQNLISTAYAGSEAIELDTAALSDGTLVKNILASQLNTLNDKGYIFLRKHVGIAGTYFNDEQTCELATSDYGTIHTNRVMDKCAREVRKALLPKLSSPIKINEDGTMDAGVVKYLENLAGEPLARMQEAEELSAFVVTIDPAQKVLSTSKLSVAIRIIPIGIASEIEVTMGYDITIS